MRQLSALELSRLKILTEHSVEMTLIEPTETGLNKSIMDATGPVRDYLKAEGIHDYSLQRQGQDDKVQIESFLVSAFHQFHSICSLYRPSTKNGDPRIWFKGLGAFSKPNDILGIIAFDRKLYVINITQLNIEDLIDYPANSPLRELIRTIRKESNSVADELLVLLRKIALTPVPSTLDADTAVGRALETALGIAINSKKEPDYKGIELKAYRDKRGNRKNLFAQVPDWHLSKFKSSAEILDNFGYHRGEDFKLYCTVSALVKNSQGLQLRIDNSKNSLVEYSDKPAVGDFVTWSFETLNRRLLEKHNETFWISARSIQKDGIEHFQYEVAEHTKKPIVSQLSILLDQGIVTLDHLIKRQPNNKVVEKGPLFKIKPKSLSLLFPPSTTYALKNNV